MLDLIFLAAGDTLCYQSERGLIQGNSLYYNLIFNFDEQWAGMVKHIVVEYNGTPYVDIIENQSETKGFYKVPAVQDADLKIGVYGSTGAEDTPIISTNLINIKVKQGAYSSDDITPLSTSVWEVYQRTIIEYVNEVRTALTNYYNKSEIDATVAELENEIATKADSDSVYTKSETNFLLDDKADKDTTYTKSEVNGLLNDKADKATTLSGYGITDAYTKSEVDTALSAKADETEVTAIEELIPNQASSSNQLADKNFVNSSIATNTAYYISDNGQPFDSLEDLQAYSGTLSNNDYAFVAGEDSEGNTTYTRYKYSTATTPPAWSEEYVLNNSSFTAEQWAAISSGITSGDVSKLAGIEAGAQVNDIETISVNGVPQTIISKNVDIEIPNNIENITSSASNGGGFAVPPGDSEFDDSFMQYTRKDGIAVVGAKRVGDTSTDIILRRATSPSTYETHYLSEKANSAEVGDLLNLPTTDKTSIVNSIIELDNSKTDNPTVSTLTGLSVSFVMTNNYIYSCTGTVTDIDIDNTAFVANISPSDCCELLFTAGTGMTITTTSVVKWKGDDCNSSYVFTPVQGQHYTIVFYYNGSSLIGLVSAE